MYIAIAMGFSAHKNAKKFIQKFIMFSPWDQSYMCHGQGCRVLLGMGDLPPLIGILLMGIFSPLLLLG